jgi:hypothetical protein
MVNEGECNKKHLADRQEFYAALSTRVPRWVFGSVCAFVAVLGGGMFLFVETDVSAIGHQQGQGLIQSAVDREKVQAVKDALEKSEADRKDFQAKVLGVQGKILETMTRLEQIHGMGPGAKAAGEPNASRSEQ